MLTNMVNPGDGSYASGSGFQGNISLSCTASNIQEPVMLPYSMALLITVRMLQSILLFLIFLFGTSFNIFVIVLVRNSRPYHLELLFFGFDFIYYHKFDGSDQYHCESLGVW